jgi:hypothetical protein
VTAEFHVFREKAVQLEPTLKEVQDLRSELKTQEAKAQEAIRDLN